MTYRKVGVKDINFKASPEFIKEVKRETDRDLERDMGGVKVIRKAALFQGRAHRQSPGGDREERSPHPRRLCLHQQPRAVLPPLMELKELTNDKTSPIDSLGRGSHKVWVKEKKIT